MPRQAAPTSLNLPTLLSFNELAWVAVSAMALFSGYLLTQTGAHPAAPTEGPARAEEQAQQRLAELEDQRRNLLQQLAAASDSIATLQTRQQEWSNRLAQATAQWQEAADRLAESSRNAAEWRSRLAQTEGKLAEAESQRRDLESRLALLAASNTWLTARLQEAVKTADGRYEILVETERRLAEATHQLTAALAQLAVKPSEGSLRQELLSLRGPMSNVVILLDRSASMKDSGRWDDALRVIESWIEHLPIERCAVIAFGSDCQAIPALGEFVDVGGSSETAPSARARLLRHVRALEPGGETAMVEALEWAYQFPGVDTLILFTDGEPLDPRRANPRKAINPRREAELSSGERRRIARVQVEEALALSRKHAHIPINVVAVGDYFADWKAQFLLGLARNTHGAFLGR